MWHSAFMVAYWFIGFIFVCAAIGISDDGFWPSFISLVIAVFVFAWSIAQWFH
jgi:hypothetical protein